MTAKPASDWSAALYLKFEDERTRPSRDLLARIPVDKPKRVVDIGCGPGNSTEILVERWPDAEVSGFDTSPDMIEKAGKRLPGCSFELADAATWTPDEPVDVIFANAVFQWLPEHPQILQRLMGFLAPGGALAVQMPDNRSEPSHMLMEAAAAEMPFAAKMAKAGRGRLPSAGEYYDLLVGLSARLDIWHTIYNHPMANVAAIVEWFSSTGLRPYVEPLDAAERAVFLTRYEEKLAEAYPARADGKVLLRFPRLFLVATQK
ncbi:MAG: trans-aconitate 2-methyltransferase [Mesorhizobium sp.]